MSKEFEIKQNEVSDIQLNIQIEEITDQEVELQRTEQWQEERRGNWTGSQIKNLMSCDRKGGKLNWFDKEKAYKFSEGAVKYIFSNAMERITGRYIQTSTTKEMAYGTKIEPLIFKRASELLKEIGELKKVGFKTFEDFPTAGVSSDSILEVENKIIASVEMKACTSWGTLYERTFELTDETSIDFWQTQTQMIAWNVNQTYYIVVSPPKDIMVYLKAEDIESLYDFWCNETEITIEIIKKSEIHCNAIYKRIQIAENTVNHWIQNQKSNLKTILYENIEKFKQAENQFQEVPKVKFQDISFDSNSLIETTKEIQEIQVNSEEIKQTYFDDISKILPF